MMRILRQYLCITLLGTALLACQQGVTDVGNPNVADKPPQASPNTLNPGPTLGQLIGAYSSPSSVAADVKPTSDGSPSPTTDPTAAPVTPECKTDPQAIQSITSTMDPTQIVLNYFLDYGSSTDNILAGYDSKTGGITFQISDTTVAFASCSGSAKNSADGISISLQCKARASGHSNCQVTFKKE